MDSMQKMDKPSSYFVLADRHFGGGLTEALSEWRGEGKTYEWIHHELWDKDIPVSLPTVVRWCNMYI